MKNPFRLIGGIFLIVGLPFLCVAAFLLLRDASFAGNAASAEGRVGALLRQVDTEPGEASSVTYSALIRFSDQHGRAQEFSETLRTNPPRFAVGDRVSVIYDPARPSRAAVDDFWGRKGLAVIFLGLGAIFASIGAVFLSGDIRRSRMVARLQRQGVAIEADFLEVFRDRFISINHRNPFRVAAQAKDPRTGELRRFESAPIWVDPTAELLGRKLTVLIDPARPKDYYVDLSAVIGKTGGDQS
ncbi:DUF3592 domain-containing protein [Altererythrobacter xixiisoli]|uniref:DUF3592 domain-containing protein n=1 Tax=Croceibacterium xixiisoli TaxID=1476466 RepID=A0A6I4TVC6_9SPHN|nr:DUF3592 domain-containing protein [Croceibacterium xixiisoli]MXO99169.1 DUF3592 domain-containing protein [Croceibacterium xixiisoli]